jgi:hypothetical protein
MSTKKREDLPEKLNVQYPGHHRTNTIFLVSTNPPASMRIR